MLLKNCPDTGLGVMRVRRLTFIIEDGLEFKENSYRSKFYKK